jgi:hypothetical protein
MKHRQISGSCRLIHRREINSLKRAAAVSHNGKVAASLGLFANKNKAAPIREKERMGKGRGKELLKREAPLALPPDLFPKEDPRARATPRTRKSVGGGVEKQ